MHFQVLKQTSVCKFSTQLTINEEIKMSTTMYGSAIQEAIASGDLAKMKAVAKAAEEKVKEEGDVAAALEALKIEIAKAEAALRRGGK